ncbi:MAG: GNAT family N-acetyltransferase, partial [Promethearchaeota archaeon]
EVRMLPFPAFLRQPLPDGTPMSYVALVHGSDTLASTIVQHCDYFTQGKECRFCTIPRSLQLDRTILRKTPEQLLAVLRAAEQEGLASNLLMTIGSQPRPDRGVTEYVEFVSFLRQHTQIPICVQIEPPENPHELDALRDAGVDSVGIHLEIFDDDLRQKYCPGKFAHASYADYLACWRHAVKLFGEGQVSTFILLGFGENTKRLRKELKRCIDIGVIPVLVPVRPNPGSHLEGFTPSYVGKTDQIVDLYLACARLLQKRGLNPLTHPAGCVRCGGCTALREAYQAVTRSGEPEIVEFGEADAPELARLIKLVWSQATEYPTAWRRKRCLKAEEIIDEMHRGYQYFGARQAGQITGFYKTLLTPEGLLGEHQTVHPSFRHRGLVRAMYRQFLTYAWQLKTSSNYCNILVSQKGMCQLVERLGFKPDGPPYEQSPGMLVQLYRRRTTKNLPEPLR